MPHVKDYSLEITYEDGSIERVSDGMKLQLKLPEPDSHEDSPPKAEAKPISLYNPDQEEKHPQADDPPKDIPVPEYNRPNILQTPSKIPPLYPFHRTCVYLLLGPKTSDLKPKSVTLKGTSPQGPLEIEIPIQVREDPDQMIHQLAARKETQDLEEGRGWVAGATVDSAEGGLVSEKSPELFEKLLQKEAVRLGVEFQVGGKFCSFVAVEANQAEIEKKRREAAEALRSPSEDWEILDDANDDLTMQNLELSSTEDTSSSEEEVSGVNRFLRDEDDDDDDEPELGTASAAAMADTDDEDFGKQLQILARSALGN